MLQRFLRMVSFLLAFVVLFAVCACTPVTRTNTKTPYTILIILNGSDLESNHQAASYDLAEMLAIRNTKNANIIIQTGGTSTWHSHDISNTLNQRYRVVNGQLELIESVGNVSLGDASTVSNFISWGIENYPANRYALFFWNHGGGPYGGYGHDELFNDNLDILENKAAIQTAFEETQTTFEIVGYDCCLMGSLEYASILQPYTRYFIASEELEPGHGWNYTALLQAIVDNPYINGDALGCKIVNGFEQQSKQYHTFPEITLSVIDTAQLNAVRDNFNSFINTISEEFDNSTHMDKIIKARLGSEDYGTSPYLTACKDLVDIWDLANNLAPYYPNACRNLKASIEQAVIYDLHGDAKPNAHGLSIYWPGKNMSFANYLLENNQYFIYSYLNISNEYEAFLKEYTSYLKDNGTRNISPTMPTQPPQFVEFLPIPQDSMTSNYSTRYNLSNANMDINGTFLSLWVDPLLSTDIETAYLCVGKIMENGDVKILGRTSSDVYVEDSGEIWSSIFTRWESLNGEVVPLYELFVNTEEGFSKYGIPILLNSTPHFLVVLYNEIYPNGEILGARQITKNGVAMKNFTPVEQGDEIAVIYEWEYADCHIDYEVGESFTVDKLLTLDLIELNNGNYVFGFEIIDIYQNKEYSDFIVYEFD